MNKHETSSIKMFNIKNKDPYTFADKKFRYRKRKKIKVA